MLSTSNPVEVLSDGEVKNFFINILDSDLSSEEKYNLFMEFFRRRNQLKAQLVNHVDKLLRAEDSNEVARIVSLAGQELGSWDPQAFKAQLLDSVRRSVRRLKVSQHRDGGWGPNVEQSEVWGTAYSIQCLQAARDLNEDFQEDLDWMIYKGIALLEDRPGWWATIDLGPQGEIPVYRAAMALKCLRQANKPYRDSTAAALAHTLQMLGESQNADGGWDAQLWGSDRWPVRTWSEAGATGAAVQSLCEVGGPSFMPVIRKGVEWLVSSQNEDGSWNNESCRPELPPYKITGHPAINKTCDALSGMLSVHSVGLPLTPYHAAINKAVEWLQRQQKPILGDGNAIMGWGWHQDTPSGDEPVANVFNLENTSMTLETLIKAPNPSLPLLISSIQWLISEQVHQDGDVMDGAWAMGHTARIALAMASYYKKITTDSGFATA